LAHEGVCRNIGVMLQLFDLHVQVGEFGVRARLVELRKAVQVVQLVHFVFLLLRSEFRIGWQTPGEVLLAGLGYDLPC
jgi:hypothetical protein